MKERFEHTLQERLRDFSLKAEPADWTRIERVLAPEKPKRSPLYRWIPAAAAVLIAGLCGFFLMYRPEPETENLRQIVEKAIESKETNPDNLLKTKGEDPAVKIRQEFAKRANGSSPSGGPGSEADQPIVAVAQGFPSATVEGKEAPNTSGQIASSRPAVRAGNNSNSYIQERHIQMPRQEKNKKSWSLALFANGAGGKNEDNSFNVKRKSSFANSGSADDFTLTLGEAGSSLVQVSLDEAGGIYSAEIGRWDHAIPLSFGLTIRHNLTHRLGVETGVTYTYLSSSQETSAIKRKQQLHYIGIPIEIVYTPFKIKDFDIYMRGGGAADFNVAGQLRTTYETGRTSTNKFTDDNVLWSVNISVGAMYNFSDRFGLYLEPGVNHYFNNSGQPESYRTENPTGFNLKVGLRTTF